VAKQTSAKKITKKTTKKNTAQPNQTLAEQEKELKKMIAENDSVELKFAWQEINPLYVKELKKLAKNLKLKGFRKGCAPPELAAKEISPEKVVDAVLRRVLPKAYEKTIKEGNYTPLSDPEFQAISLNKDNDWIIKASFAQKPKFTLGNWKKVVDQAKKKALQEIEKHNKKITAETQLKKASTTKQTNTKTRSQPRPQAQQPLSPQQQKEAIIQAVLGSLAEQIKPAIPLLLIQQNTRQELDNFLKQLKQLNVKLEEFLKARNMTQDQLTMEMFLQSLNKLQVEFIINAIAEQEKIKAEDKDVEARIKTIEDEDTKKKVEQDMQYQSYLRAVIAKQKVLDFLVQD